MEARLREWRLKKENNTSKGGLQSKPKKTLGSKSKSASSKPKKTLGSKSKPASSKPKKTIGSKSKPTTSRKPKYPSLPRQKTSSSNATKNEGKATKPYSSNTLKARKSGPGSINENKNGSKDENRRPANTKEPVRTKNKSRTPIGTNRPEISRPSTSQLKPSPSVATTTPKSQQPQKVEQKKTTSKSNPLKIVHRGKVETSKVDMMTLTTPRAGIKAQQAGSAKRRSVSKKRGSIGTPRRSPSRDGVCNEEETILELRSLVKMDSAALDHAMRYQRNLLVQWCFINARAIESFKKQQKHALHMLTDVEKQLWAKQDQLVDVQRSLEKKQILYNAKKLIIAQTKNGKAVMETFANLKREHQKLLDAVHIKMHQISCNSVVFNEEKLLKALQQSESLLSQLPLSTPEHTNRISTLAAVMKKLSSTILQERSKLEMCEQYLQRSKLLMQQERSLRIQIIEMAGN